jgi:hypothetical protein
MLMRFSSTCLIASLFPTNLNSAEIICQSETLTLFKPTTRIIAFEGSNILHLSRDSSLLSNLSPLLVTNKNMRRVSLFDITVLVRFHGNSFTKEILDVLPDIKELLRLPIISKKTQTEYIPFVGKKSRPSE